MTLKCCETCGTPIPNRLRGRREYAARRFCGRKCVRPKRQSVPEVVDAVFCIVCGKECRRGRKEHPTHYRKRKYCSTSCSVRDRHRRERERRAKESQRPVIRAVLPAPTEAEWLALNGGPTLCPTMYAAPIEHALAPSYLSGGARRGR